MPLTEAIVHILYHTLEGFKLVEVGNMKAKHMVIAMMCAVFFGILAAFWSYLVVSYDIGANPGLGKGGYNKLRKWLYYPSETNIPAVIFMGVGFLFIGLLWWLRSRFPMFLFHPTGYAVASSYVDIRLALVFSVHQLGNKKLDFAFWWNSSLSSSAATVFGTHIR